MPVTLTPSASRSPPRGTLGACRRRAPPPTRRPPVPSSISRAAAEHAARAAADERRRARAPRATPSSVASGAARCAPDANTNARSAGAPPSAGARPRARLDRRRPAGPRPCESPLPMRTPTVRTILPRRMARRDTAAVRRRDRDLRADGHRQDRRRGRARRAAARRAASDPVAVSADALQVYGGLETLTGVATAAEQRARSSTGSSRSCPSTRRFSAGEYAALAHAEIDGLLAAGRAADRRRRHRPLPARRARRPDAAPAAARRGRARRWEDELERRGARARCTPSWPRARAVGGRGRSSPHDRSRIVRALELLELGELEPPATARTQLWTGETRHPTLLVGLVDGARGALRADRRARRRDGRRRRGRGGAAPPTPRARRETARKALGFDELLAGDVEAMKRRTRNYAKRQLTWMRKLAGRRDDRRDRPQRRGRRGRARSAEAAA